MNFNEYQELAQRTSNSDCTGYDKLTNGCLGLAGETGECADILKKFLFQGHDLDEEHLIEELGDVLWYCAEVATALRMPLEAVAEKNVQKLKKRYPDGFSALRSRERGC